MTDLNEKKYKQLALFSVIIAEIVITPCVLGGLAYWLTKGKSFQMMLTCVAAFLGLCIGIYRIYTVYKTEIKDGPGD